MSVNTFVRSKRAQRVHVPTLAAQLESLLKQIDELARHQSFQLDVAGGEELIFVYGRLVVEHVAHELVNGVDERLVILAIQLHLVFVQDFDCNQWVMVEY